MLFLGVLCFPLATRVSLDNRIEIFLDQDSKSAKQYARFIQTFGSDEFLLAAYAGKDLLDPILLDLQLDILTALEKVPSIARISAIPQIYRDLFGEEDVDALREELFSTPFYEAFLISEDGHIAAFFIEVHPMDRAEARVQLVEEIEQILAPLRTAGLETHLVGPPALHVMMERTTQREALRTFPVAFLLSVVILGFLFRSARATLSALLSVGFTLLFTLAFMSLTGVSINMITSPLPMLLWVLSLSNLIHIFRRYQEDRREDRDRAADVEAAVRMTAIPCTIAMVTTAVGFLSLTTSAMEPLKDLGVCAAVGLLLGLAVSLGLAPQLLIWMRVPGLHRRPTPFRWTDPLCALSARRGRYFLGFATILMLFSWLGINRLNVESNPIRFLPENDAGARSYQFVGTHLTGLYSMEVVLDTPESWLTEDALIRIEDLGSRLKDLAGVAKVLSPVDVLKKMNQWEHAADPSHYRLPNPLSRSADLISLAQEMGSSDLERFVCPEENTVRLLVLMKEMDSSQALMAAHQAEELLRELPRSYTGYVTGIALRIAEVQLTLVKTQRQSFTLAFFCIFLCILLGLRSWRMTLTSFLPNLMPIWVTYGLMGWTGLPLNPATVMVASVALGIAVDDAIHLLNAYQVLRRMGKVPEDAVRLALRKVGPALTMTTVTACIGFFALTRSSFSPVREFGLLSGLAMLIALAGNVFLIPALLTLKKRSDRRS